MTFENDLKAMAEKLAQQARHRSEAIDFADALAEQIEEMVLQAYDNIHGRPAWMDGG